MISLKNYSKRAMMVLLALVMVLATATLSFAAERNGKVSQAKSGEITLENAKFVRANGKKGIKLQIMRFSFSPFKPPGMPNPVKNVYFICDEFNK